MTKSSTLERTAVAAVVSIAFSALPQLGQPLEGGVLGGITTLKAGAPVSMAQAASAEHETLCRPATKLSCLLAALAKVVAMPTLSLAVQCDLTPKQVWVNNHPYCLHLWRPVGVQLPRPPSLMVGCKAVGVLA